LRAAAPGAYVYVSPKSNATYIYNNTQLNFVQAEQTCNDQGGHLVTYMDLNEQLEVEAYYSRMGYLFPRFSSFYWIGLRTQSWPNFIFIDRLDGGSYANWGTIPDGGLDEPNNIHGMEFCAGANFTELRANKAWGWSDELCTTRAAFMCKIRSERCCRAAPAPAPARDPPLLSYTRLAASHPSSP
jgi:hypothetical protein